MKMSQPEPTDQTVDQIIRERNAALTNPYQRWVLTLDNQIALIDAYVVLNAFPASAEVHHAIKKLLAAGCRTGKKSYLTDVVESKNQLEMEIVRLIKLDAPFIT